MGVFYMFLAAWQGFFYFNGDTFYVCIYKYLTGNDILR